MTNALWITLIGMGLVFVAILLLWGGMALLVRLTTEREGSEETEEVAPQKAPQKAATEASQETGAASTAQADRRRRAAAAAVTVALALHKPARPVENVRPDGALSGWQAVNRASQINQALNLPGKKVAR